MTPPPPKKEDHSADAWDEFLAAAPDQLKECVEKIEAAAEALKQTSEQKS
jgi:hypothetical protein